MKKLIFLFIVFFSNIIFSQIKVDTAGDFWDKEVNSALNIIKSTNIDTYDWVVDNVYRISIWNQSYNSFEIVDGKAIILLSSSNFGRGSVNNIASTIVHETYHINHRFEKNNVCEEELQAYLFELNFLFKIKDVENWLVEFVYDQASKYRVKIEKGECGK